MYQSMLLFVFIYYYKVMLTGVIGTLIKKTKKLN